MVHIGTISADGTLSLRGQLLDASSCGALTVPRVLGSIGLNFSAATDAGLMVANVGGARAALVQSLAAALDVDPSWVRILTVAPAEPGEIAGPAVDVVFEIAPPAGMASPSPSQLAASLELATTAATIEHGLTGEGFPLTNIEVSVAGQQPTTSSSPSASEGQEARIEFLLEVEFESEAASIFQSRTDAHTLLAEYLAQHLGVLSTWISLSSFELWRPAIRRLRRLAPNSIVRTQVSVKVPPPAEPAFVVGIKDAIPKLNSLAPVLGAFQVISFRVDAIRSFWTSPAVMDNVSTTATAVTTNLPAWEVGQWSSCSKVCGDGHRQRIVNCSSGDAAMCEQGSEAPLETEVCTEYSGCPFEAWCPLGRGADLGCAVQLGLIVAVMLFPCAAIMICAYALIRRQLRQPTGGVVLMRSNSGRMLGKVPFRMVPEVHEVIARTPSALPLSASGSCGIAEPGTESRTSLFSRASRSSRGSQNSRRTVKEKVRVIWDVEEDQMNWFNLPQPSGGEEMQVDASKSDLPTETGLQLPPPESVNRRGRGGTKLLPGAYTAGERMEYFSTTVGLWVPGLVESSCGIPGDRVEEASADVRLLANGQLRQCVTLVAIRPPLQTGEPCSVFSSQADRWLDATVRLAPGGASAHLGYQVVLDGARHHHTLVVLGSRLRRRFPDGARVEVYLAGEIGWALATVIQTLAEEESTRRLQLTPPVNAAMAPEVAVEPEGTSCPTCAPGNHEETGDTSCEAGPNSSRIECEEVQGGHSRFSPSRWRSSRFLPAISDEHAASTGNPIGFLSPSELAIPVVDAGANANSNRVEKISSDHSARSHGSLSAQGSTGYAATSRASRHGRVLRADGREPNWWTQVTVRLDSTGNELQVGSYRLRWWRGA